MGGAGGLIGSRQRLMSRVLASHCLSVAGAGSIFLAACISLSPYRSLCCSGATHGRPQDIGVAIRERPRQRCCTARLGTRWCCTAHLVIKWCYAACQRDRVDSGFLQRGNPVVGGWWERLEDQRALFGIRRCQGVQSSCAGNTLPQRAQREHPRR